jgi:hypothetical protein
MIILQSVYSIIPSDMTLNVPKTYDLSDVGFADFSENNDVFKTSKYQYRRLESEGEYVLMWNRDHFRIQRFGHIRRTKLSFTSEENALAWLLSTGDWVKN